MTVGYERRIGAAVMALALLLGVPACSGNDGSDGGGIGQTEDPNRPEGTEPRTLAPPNTASPSADGAGSGNDGTPTTSPTAGGTSEGGRVPGAGDAPSSSP